MHAHSLRYAVQRLSLSAQNAPALQHEKVNVEDVQRVESLLVDIGEAAEHLKKQRKTQETLEYGKTLILDFPPFSVGPNDMPKEKRKKGFFDLIGPDEDFLFDAKSFSEGGSGYSLSVAYDEKDNPAVKVQTHGDADLAELPRDIEQRYPGAKIEGLEKQPLIRVVAEEPTSEIEKQKNEEQKDSKRKRKRRKKPLIRVVE